ncbi:MAG: protein kinase domain-containing protein [Pyrinomonadaceae bacterium]
MKECPKCRHCYDDNVELCPNDNSKPVPTIEGGTTISGRYILESRLGQGGMGIVFRAKHKFLKSFHAVKIILPSLVTNDANLLVRFNQEAVLAASIDHPNVIRVTDFGIENDDMPFLVMEFIDGNPLSAYLKADKPIDLKNALEIFIPIAQAVAEAHRKGIVHRDLKPENVMVQKNLPLVKAIKVLDFGLAKIKSGTSYPSLVQAKTMNIVGSPPYMSPEQWTGDGVDHRTDIYALSAMLFQMLTGRLPFQADSMPAMMYQHLSGALPTAASLGINISPPVEAILQKGMQKDPAHRFESMEQLLAALGSAVGQPGKKPLPGEVTDRMPGSAPIPKPSEDIPALSDSEKERFYSFFDSKQKPESIGDPKLAQDFLEAQDRIETAKTEAINADLLVQELAEAQRLAEEAQNKALQAKQQIEADVRRQVEAEMQRLAAKDQTKQEAEAERLAKEVKARRDAEERANHLAKAALESQQLAELERKQRQEEAQKRELHEGVRREAEVEAQRLAKQVAESRKQYEDAKNEAAREAQFRADAEAKQKKIESELQAVAASEAERRKMVEASAKKFIEEQSGKFEKEASAAKQRLDEAKLLIEQEAKKRESAEAARVHAEEEAQRLSQEIIKVQQQMHEMQQHITTGSHGPLPSGSQGPLPSTTGQSSISLNPLNPDATSRQMPSMLVKTGQFSNRKVIGAVAAGIVAIVVLAGAGIGTYLYLRPSRVATNQAVVNTNTEKPPPAGPQIERIRIEGGTFKMGRDDVPDRKSTSAWFDQFPANSVEVKSFRIDKYETTNAQYAEFLKENKDRKPPGGWDGQNPPAGKESHPVTNVTYDDAVTYAFWITFNEKKTCRLPTEAEWEYAARNGAQATSYPWGTDWRRDAAILGGSAAPVGTSNDETLSGVKDMLGNVTEWTSDVYGTYKDSPFKLQSEAETLVIRGLNFKAQTTHEKDLFKKPEFMLTYRNNMKKTDAKDYLGFRLVCSL